MRGASATHARHVAIGKPLPHRVGSGAGEKLLPLIETDNRGRLALGLDVEHNVERHARLHKADLEELGACGDVCSTTQIRQKHAALGQPSLTPQ